MSRGGMGYFGLVGLAASILLGLSVFGASSVSAMTPCGAPVSGNARVVMVVDNGVDGVSVECIVVPRGSTGSQVLRQRAAQLGAALPSHAGSGLLCTIDSFPSSGCSETSSGSYWANFSGGGASWNYSSYNPFIRRVCDGDVEGWRYVERGTGAAGDAAPRISPDSVRPSDARGCDEPSTSSSSGVSGDVGSSAAVPNDPLTGAAPQGVASTASDVGETPAGDPIGVPAGGPSGESSSGDTEARQTATAAASPQSTTSQSASTSWIGLLAALALIGVLGVAALLRSRRAS
jgi:hypothetical protein